MGLCISTHQTVHVRNQPVNEVQRKCASENTGNGNEQIAIFHRREYQTENGCSQHNTGGEGQHQVTEFMGDVFE